MQAQTRGGVGAKKQAVRTVDCIPCPLNASGLDAAALTMREADSWCAISEESIDVERSHGRLRVISLSACYALHAQYAIAYMRETPTLSYSNVLALSGFDMNSPAPSNHISAASRGCNEGLAKSMQYIRLFLQLSPAPGRQPRPVSIAEGSDRHAVAPTCPTAVHCRTRPLRQPPG